MNLQVLRLGRVEYEDGLALQRLYGQARVAGKSPDTLLLLEHPPVVTLGRGAKSANIIAPTETLSAEGVEVFETNRGGDVTYHGPGQIVGYPIFLLPENRRDVRRYVRDVEESVIRAVAKFGITAARIPRWPGIWVGEEGRDARKIGAIGVHLSRWLTSHGFALNVNTKLSHFGLIVPCGITEAGVTSMAQELGKPQSLTAVEDALAESFTDVFGAERVEPAPPLRTVSVAVLRRERARPEILLLKRTAERGGFWQLVTGRIEAGESALEAAAREVEEETGAALEPTSLGYRQSFALGETLPPLLTEAEAFRVLWPAGREVKLGPEHETHLWATPEEAAELLPFKGLKVAAELAVRAH